jgi:hypothetical protein
MIFDPTMPANEAKELHKAVDAIDSVVRPAGLAALYSAYEVKYRSHCVNTTVRKGAVLSRAGYQMDIDSGAAFLGGQSAATVVRA